MTVLLTMREGATTHSFIEYCHKEHVTVFEIRFHLINGLDPKRGERHIFRCGQAGRGSHSTTDLGFSLTKNALFYELLIFYTYNDIEHAVCALL